MTDERKSKSSEANVPDYEPEYNLDAARKRNENAENTVPAFKQMMDKLRAKAPKKP